MIKKIERNLEKKLSEMFETQSFKDVMSAIQEDENYKFSVIVTTEGVDRDGETIVASGIDYTNYLANPVVLANHEYKVESIVGKTLKIFQNQNGETIAEGVFAKGTEKAELVRTLYNQGFIKAVSVGFIPKQRNANDRSIITKWEMLEFSFVAVPANPEALSLDGKVYKSCIKEGLIIESQEEIKILANQIGVGNDISFRIKETFQNENGETIVNLYPRIGNLPFMGKILAKYENDEQILLWDELIVGTTENPYFAIQTYVKSENGPVLLTDRIITRRFEEIEVETIFLQKDFENIEFQKFNTENIDLKEIKTNIKVFGEDLRELKSILENFADDKAEQTNLEKTRKMGQELAKSLSAYLQEAKK